MGGLFVDAKYKSVSPCVLLNILLSGANEYNGGDLSKWGVCRVTAMYGVFFCVSSFNTDLSTSKWDAFSVISRIRIFNGLCTDSL